MILLLLCAFVPVAAQELPHDTTAPASAAAAEDPVFLLRQRSTVFLPVFREYERVMRVREEEIALRNSVAVQRVLERLRETRPDGLNTWLLARYNFGAQYAHLTYDASLWEALGRVLLGEVLRYAYIYARESVRRNSVTEFDYLYLPQGPGVIRSMGEARDAALLRGEMQTWSVWEELYIMNRNKPCVPPGK
jgi:hypothetical protein